MGRLLGLEVRPGKLILRLGNDSKLVELQSHVRRCVLADHLEYLPGIHLVGNGTSISASDPDNLDGEFDSPPFPLSHHTAGPQWLEKAENF